MDERSYGEKSHQFLGDWEFLDEFPIVMVTPPSSPEPVTPAVEDDDGRAPDAVVRDASNAPIFEGNIPMEGATALGSTSSTIGKARVSGMERAGPHACSQKQPPPASGEARVSGDQPASAVNFGGSKRVLPASASESEEWGGGKWRVDGRTLRKKQNVVEETDTMFLKNLLEALIPYYGEAGGEVQDMKDFNYVETLKSLGLKFPD